MLSEAQKLNKITKVLRIVCREFQWMGFWKSMVAPFITKNREKILALYDEVERVMKED